MELKLISYALGELGVHTDKPLQIVFGWVNAPFAWLMGVPAQFHDCDLRAVRLREFFQHCDSSRRHRLARA